MGEMGERDRWERGEREIGKTGGERDGRDGRRERWERWEEGEMGEIGEGKEYYTSSMHYSHCTSSLYVPTLSSSSSILVSNSCLSSVPIATSSRWDTCSQGVGGKQQAGSRGALISPHIYTLYMSTSSTVSIGFYIAGK